MKQARKWLPIAAALMLLPQAALAQKKPKKPAAPVPAPAAGGEIELDAPTGTAPVPAAGAATTGGGGICDIDPSACPKGGALDLGAAAGKTVNAEVYAVQQIYALR